MGRLFGTDGIRGVVGENLTADLAFRTGKAIGAVLKEEKGRAPLLTIGKDTRISSDMLESALTAGICAVGGDVMPLGVLPTPAVAYLTAHRGADAGIVISASHNAYEYNGIKVFSEKGYKLSDATEERIESKILGEVSIAEGTGASIGVLRRGLRASKEAYIDYLAGTVPEGLAPLRVLVDCANGAASATAPALFSRFGCRAEFIHNEPDGVNVNARCGSTYLAPLAERVIAGGYDLGIAFDGDADRCLMVDEKGGIIDGDKYMAVCGADMKRRGVLNGNTIVATVMSNLGLHEFCRNHQINLVCTSVGDRNVLEEMLARGYRLGGEQSGHIIFTEYATTGDGQLSALQFLRILSASGAPASELARVCPQYPQILLNVPIPSELWIRDRIMSSETLARAIREQEDRLGDEGRVLVRPSGTEALIRVMIEAKTEEIASESARSLASVVEWLRESV